MNDPTAWRSTSQQHIRDELREKYFHNQVFDSMDSLEDHLVIEGVSPQPTHFLYLWRLTG